MAPSIAPVGHDTTNGGASSSLNYHIGNSRTSVQEPRTLVPGVYVPTIAFFDNSGNEDVDVPTTEKHAARLAKTGIAGIVTHGSNGEAVHLDREERIRITKVTRRALWSVNHDEMPVIVGCGTQSTRETIRLCKDAYLAGGDYGLILPPSYYGALISPDSLLSHFRAIADASPMPLIIYNFPAAAGGLDMNSDQIIALSTHPNIVGAKLTCGNTGKLGRVVVGAKGEFLTMGGSADFILPTMISGGSGVIAGLANIAPKCCVRLIGLYEEGKLAQAQQLQAVVARADWVAIQGGFVAIKAALRLYEGYGGLPRRPCSAPDRASMLRLSDQFQEIIELENSL